MILPRFNPATAFLLLIARLTAPPPPFTESLWRCKHCKAECGPNEAAVPMHLTHPINNCRFGKRGNGAVPVHAVEPRGRNYSLKQHPRGM